MKATPDGVASAVQQVSVIGATLRGLGVGLQVRQIATPDADIKYCAPDASVADVRDHPDLSAFDYIPVKEDGQYLGVLHRAEAAPEGTVKDRMDSFHQRMLVAADMPILEFMEEMGHVPYGLVVEGTRIRGFVTPSDLLKLPVRVSVFALITHLEMVMAELITASLTTDEWLGLLTDGRRAKVQQKIADIQKKQGLEPSAIACTDYCDKRVILGKHLVACGALTEPEAKRFEASIDDIEGVRNTLAHAGDYAQNREKLGGFLANVKATQVHINFLEAQFQRPIGVPS